MLKIFECECKSCGKAFLINAKKIKKVDCPHCGKHDYVTIIKIDENGDE